MEKYRHDNRQLASGLPNYDEDGGVPQLFCLVRGQEVEFGYVALAELEAVRSPLGLAVERDEDFQECSLAELRRRLRTPPRRPPPAGYWRRGEDWWTAEEVENGVLPGDAVWVDRPAGDNGGATPSGMEGGMLNAQRDRAADAMDLWRAGERNVARRTLTWDWRDDYQAAVDGALAYLQRYTTMAGLVAAYFDDRLEDAVLQALCRRPSGRILNFGDVEDAAYWRRAQQLIAAVMSSRGG